MILETLKRLHQEFPVGNTNHRHAITYDWAITERLTLTLFVNDAEVHLHFDEPDLDDLDQFVISIRKLLVGALGIVDV